MQLTQRLTNETAKARFHKQRSWCMMHCKQTAGCNFFALMYGNASTRGCLAQLLQPLCRQEGKHMTWVKNGAMLYVFIFLCMYICIYIYIISIYVCIIYYTYMTGFCNHTQRIYVCKATICAKSRQRPLRQLCQAENRGGGELPVNNNAMLNDKQLNQT